MKPCALAVLCRHDSSVCGRACPEGSPSGPHKLCAIEQGVTAHLGAATLQAPIPQTGFGQLRGRSAEPIWETGPLGSRDAPTWCAPRALAKGDPMETGPPLGRELATTADGQT